MSPGARNDNRCSVGLQPGTLAFAALGEAAGDPKKATVYCVPMRTRGTQERTASKAALTLSPAFVPIPSISHTTHQSPSALTPAPGKRSAALPHCSCPPDPKGGHVLLATAFLPPRSSVPSCPTRAVLCTRASSLHFRLGLPQRRALQVSRPRSSPRPAAPAAIAPIANNPQTVPQPRSI